MKKLPYFLLALALLLAVTACENAAPVEDPASDVSADTQQTPVSDPVESELFWATNVDPVQYEITWSVAGTAEDYLLELTDRKYQGRVTGSEGNRLAADWIESQFVQLGLQSPPSLTGFRHSFYTQLYELLGGYAAVVAADGTETELELGTDWLFRASYEAVDLTLPLSADLADCQAGTAFLDAEQTTQAAPLQYIEVAVGDLAAGIPYFTSSKQAASQVIVTQAVYDRLCQPGARLHLRLPVGVTRGMADNVVGYLPGADSRKLVLLSAHFDGSGQCAMWMPSAYDNASGVATLLQTAAWLAGAEELPCDVMFAAFNAEEIGLQGSAAFAGELSGLYDQILVVNIDCVGWRDTPLVVYGEAVSAVLRSDLAGGMGIQYRDAAYSGDQLSFSKPSMQAVTVTQDSSMEDAAVRAVMHSAYDTVDNLDPSLLDELAKDLAAWVIERGGESLTAYVVYW